MKRRSEIFALGVLACVAAQASMGHAFGQELKDATGHSIHLKDQPQRIVTLLPSLGELAAELLEGDHKRLVGVSDYTDYPEVLTKLPSIGPYHRFSLEKVVSLKPDLVLASADGNSKDQVLHLRELGIPVIVIDTSTLKQVEESIAIVGQALGVSVRARKNLDELRAGVAEFRKRASARSNKSRVLLQLGAEPLVVVGGQSFLQEALETVGAMNVYHDSKDRYPRPALEDAVSRNPQVILVMALGKDMKEFEKMTQRWSKFDKIPAVQSKQVKVLRADALLRPGLRLLEGLRHLEQAVYGKK